MVMVMVMVMMVMVMSACLLLTYTPGSTAGSSCAADCSQPLKRLHRYNQPKSHRCL